MRRLYTEMVADLFHAGHVAFLQRARLHCDHLTVGLLVDELVRQAKGDGRPVVSYEERRVVLEACRYVDSVVPVRSLGVDASRLDAQGCERFAFAASDANELAAKLRNCSGLPPERVLVLPYTIGVSTSQIIDRVLRAPREPRRGAESDE